MKRLSVDQLSPEMIALCEQAAGGEIIQLRLSDGALVELKSIGSSAFSANELAESYTDKEWAQFENNCGKSSD